MKKYTVFSLSFLLTASMLTACSPKQETMTSSSKETSTSLVSSTSTSSSSSKASSTLDPTAISKGDYTSLKGTWKNSQGHTLVFDEKGLVNGGKINYTPQLEDGILETSVFLDSGSGFVLLMIPKGMTIPQVQFSEGSDPTDASKDRLVATQQLLSAGSLDAYYWVSEDTTTKTSGIPETSTPISLSSGQASIDYLTAIYGDKDWTVIEDNYNRTQDNPYNLLQGNDSSLFRVFQDGTITDINYNTVYQP